MTINNVFQRVLSNNVSNKLMSSVRPLKLLMLRFLMYRQHKEKDCLKPELAGSLHQLPPIEVPRSLGLEGFSACNANCIFCEKQFTQRKAVKMDIEFSRRIITEFISMGGRAINFACMTNEPMLDEDLYGKIKHAYHEARRMGKPIKVIVITNGTLLNWNENYKKICESGLKLLRISMSSFNKADYDKTYRIDKYPDLLQGLLLLLKENRKRGYPMKIYISIRTGRPLKDILKDRDFGLILPFIDFRSVIVDYTHTYYVRDSRVESLFIDEMRKRENIPEQQRIRPCSSAYDIIVTSEGKVRVCICHAGPEFNSTGNDELVFGNLKEMSLQEALQSRKKAELNKLFNEGRMPEICRKCSQYRPMSPIP